MFLQTQIILAIMTILGISGDSSPHTGLNTVLLNFSSIPTFDVPSQGHFHPDSFGFIGVCDVLVCVCFPPLFFFGD